MRSFMRRCTWRRMCFCFPAMTCRAAWAGVARRAPGELWKQWMTVWPSVLDDLQKRRFIQVGLFAWVILLALAVTSPHAMLRGMGGKNWQRLHRLVYVAAIAAVRSLLVAGEGGGAHAVEGYGGADGAAAGAGGVECAEAAPQTGGCGTSGRGNSRPERGLDCAQLPRWTEV